MKIAEIKKLAEKHSLTDLRRCEEALLNEQPLPLDIQGDDEGERLTHILAAIQIRDEVEVKGVSFNLALRNYAQRVRKSIC